MNAHELRNLARQEAASARAYLDSKREQAKAAQSDLERAAEALRARRSVAPSVTREAARRGVSSAPVKPAAASVKPAAAKPAPSAPAPTPAPPGLDGKPRRAWAKAQSVMSAENAKNFSDCYLQAAATHPNSPPAEAAIARAELEARGWVFDGRTISLSHRKSNKPN
jgi:hypothetical protein